MTKENGQMNLSDMIRDVPDFPKPGILFKDITTLLQDPQAYKRAVDAMTQRYQDQEIDVVVAIESRGFIFGAVLAYNLGAGFVPVRKRGKLPYKTRQVSYQLEYGADTLEIHEDAFPPQARVLVVDDLLATGGTVGAVASLLRDMQAQIVGVAFLVELAFLKGREKLPGLPISAEIIY